jgi:hypothetical protein
MTYYPEQRYPWIRQELHDPAFRGEMRGVKIFPCVRTRVNFPKVDGTSIASLQPRCQCYSAKTSVTGADAL